MDRTVGTPKQTPTQRPQDQRSAPTRYPSKGQLARSVGPCVQNGVSIGLVGGLQATVAPESRISRPSDPAVLCRAPAWRA